MTGFMDPSADGTSLHLVVLVPGTGLAGDAVDPRTGAARLPFWRPGTGTENFATDRSGKTLYVAGAGQRDACDLATGGMPSIPFHTTAHRDARRRPAEDARPLRARPCAYLPLGGLRRTDGRDEGRAQRLGWGPSVRSCPFHKRQDIRRPQLRSARDRSSDALADDWGTEETPADLCRKRSSSSRIGFCRILSIRCGTALERTGPGSQQP